MPWAYEADPDRKHKRGWTRDEAGFMDGPGGEVIGKCPACMTTETAEELLNDPQAVHVHPERGWTKEYPTMILNVHEGVLYRATWTNPGRSCHGFPEHPSRAEQLPKAVKERLLELAEARGCREEIQKCLLGKS